MQYDRHEQKLNPESKIPKGHRRRRFFKSLRGRIGIRMLLVSLVPIIVIGALVYSSMSMSASRASDSLKDSRTQLENEVIGGTLIAAADSMCGQISMFISERAADMMQLAMTPALSEAVTGGSTDDANRFLAQEKAFLVVFGEMVVTDASGNIVAATSSGTAGSQSDNEWWKLAWRDGLYVGEVIYVESMDMFTIDIATQIKDSQTGEAIGILKGSTYVAPSVAAQEFASRVPKGRVVIFDRGGRLLTDTSDARRHKEASPALTDLEQRVVTAVTEEGQISGSLVTKEVVIGYHQMAAGYIDAMYNLPNYHGVGWIVMVEQPADIASASLGPIETLQDDLRNSSNNVLLTLGVVILAVLVVGIVLAVVLSKAISGPIVRLRAGTAEVMSGNLDYRVGTDSEDEIGELSRDFDRMTSNLRRSQEDLKRYNASLEEKVEERTREVEALLRQKDEMIAQLGHDLKNPITPLLTLLPLIREQEEDPEQQALLDAAIASATYLRQLTVNTMRLAALSSADAQTATAVAKINLRQQVSEVVSRRELAAKQSGITMENHVGEDIVVEADHMGLQEVLDNLVANALKFTPEGGVVVFAAHTDGDFVTISVKDTGIGMTPEQLARVFDEFYRADPSRNAFDSSGLGLSICKRIVEQHGGKIWAESPGLGRGSTMFFTLRLAKSDTNSVQSGGCNGQKSDDRGS